VLRRAELEREEGGDEGGCGGRWVERPAARRQQPWVGVEVGRSGGSGGVRVRDLRFGGSIGGGIRRDGRRGSKPGDD
jgi:hypothetical protein